MKRTQLQKKVTKYLLVLVIDLFVLIGLVAAGGMAIESGNGIFGAVLIILGVLSIVIPLIMMLLAWKKYHPLMIEAFINEIKSNLNRVDGNIEFVTDSKKTIVFEDDHYVYNNIDYSYDIFDAGIFLKNKPKMLSDEIELVLTMFIEEEEFSIQLDGDLLNIIKNKELVIANQEDFDYFLDNTEVCTKQLLRTAAFQQRQSLVPLVFAKNKEEKKEKRKVNSKIILVNVIIIAGMIGISALFTWLGSTENGLKISDTFAYNLGFKIVYTVIILTLTFVKSKKIKWFGKATFILYLIAYWYGLLFLSARLNVLIDLIFFVTFVITGIIIIDKEKFKTNPMNRMLCFAGFMFLMVLYSTDNFELNDYGIIPLISIIIASIITLILTIITVRYYRKQLNTSKIIKKNFWVSVITIPFSIALFSFLILYFSLISLNYCLDRSSPTIIAKEIIELNKGEENESDVAIVMIEGEEVEIPISRSLYFELKVGDSIDVALYSGAFNVQYYMLD